MSRLERLLNLAACLSHTSRPLSLPEIRQRVPGYAEGDTGRRAFERDKDQLRALGFDLQPEEFGEGDTGYQLRAEDWAMGPLDLSPDEKVALSVAVSIARFAGDDASLRAAARLAAPAGEAGPVSAPLGRVGPAHAVVSDAVSRRRPLTFTYRTEGRRLHPYGMILRHGRWYVTGLDPDRGELRSFRLDRIEGQPEAGPVGHFERPDDFDPEQAIPAEPWLMAAERTTAQLAVDAAAAWWALPQLGRPPIIEENAAGDVVVEVEVALEDAFFAFVAGLLDQAEILGPPELRARFVERLEATLRP